MILSNNTNLCILHQGQSRRILFRHLILGEFIENIHQFVCFST